MSSVVIGVKLQLQDLLPGQIGTNKQWSDTFIEGVIMLADAAARERCQTYTHTQEISLVADQHNYDLDSELIAITAVEFSSDGTNYDDHLDPTTTDDLYKCHGKWRASRSTRPEEYALLGTPGVPETSTGASDGSKITIYPAHSAPTVEKIKITGTGLGTSTTTVPIDVQSKIYVPYVLAFLFGPKSPKTARRHFKSFVAGTEIVKSRFIDPYTEESTGPVR